MTLDAIDFDQPINRRGTHSMKWDSMEAIYGVPAETGIAMWVADMDFRPPRAVQAAVETMAAHGIYGYFGDQSEYHAAIRWWMAHRHGWEVETSWIFTTHGLVNGVGICIDTFTQPGDRIVLMTPVYHAFARVIQAAGREVVECRLAQENGSYRMDFAAWEAQMTGAERMLVLCSPHNPGGRVWSIDELREVAEFCTRHDLILVSDEIHHDLVFPGRRHTVMPLAAPEILDRLIMLTAGTKTFNIPGSHTGNVIIPDPALRARFAQRMGALGISANSFGLAMTTAAYSPDGAAWVDALLRYLDGNRRLFDARINAIPGLRSMTLEATYLAWVDFSGTGMEPIEFQRRVEADAQVAVNHGISFGAGGETFLRFNIATRRAVLIEALDRITRAFADLQ